MSRRHATTSLLILLAAPSAMAQEVEAAPPEETAPAEAPEVEVEVLEAEPTPAVAVETPDRAQTDEALEPSDETDKHAVWTQDPCSMFGVGGDGAPARCWRVDDSGSTFHFGGQARLIGTLYPDAPVDDEGTTIGQGPSLDQRLRLGAGVGWYGMTVSTEWDLFTGQVAGDTWDIPGFEDGRRRWARDVLAPEAFVPRRAAFDIVARDPGGGPVPMVLASGGLMPANWWGLGILANGGDRPTLFGRVDGGDRMLRARVTFAPLVLEGTRMPLFFTVGGDAVIEDDTARWASGQRAWHIIASMLWRGPEGLEAGVFFTQRFQTEAGEAPRPTTASVVDVYASGTIDLGESGWDLYLGTEDAIIAGRTERSVAYAHLDGTAILSGAMVGHARLEAPDDVAMLHVRTGWTSASGDPDAGRLGDFTLDANYNVGLVLFDELMGGIEAATWALLNDAELTGGPPDGAEAIVTEGSVRRAAWVWPMIEAQALDWLRLRGGYLAAWSTGAISQPFYTARNGGTPTNHLDTPTSGRFMGHELQWGVDLGVGPRTRAWSARPKFGVEGGVAFPSADLGGGRLVLVRATAQVDF